MRDDFSQSIKDLLANRVGQKCSNSNCRKTTRGAGTEKSAVVNMEWRDKLDTICDMLIALRKRLRIAKHAGVYSTYGEGEITYCFYDRDLAMQFDAT